MSKETNSVGYIGLLSIILSVLFIYLKLTSRIAWTWLWILAPLWIYFIGGFLLALLLAGIFVYRDLRRAKKEQSQPPKWQQRMKEMNDRKLRDQNF